MTPAPPGIAGTTTRAAAGVPGTSGTFDIRSVRYDHPDAVRLVAGLQQLYLDVYGEQDDRPTSAAEFRFPLGDFLVGYLDGAAVVCGGWRSRDGSRPGHLDGDAELKRAYIDPGVSGLQAMLAAADILAAVEDSARRAGRRRGVLDAGVRQHSAIRFFEHAGYRRIPNYGSYRGDDQTVCYARPLGRP